MGKARIFSDAARESVYQKEFDDEVYNTATQQGSYNLGSVHFSDQSGIANISQAGSDQRKANLKGALFTGNIGFDLQTVLLDVATNTINLLEDGVGNPVPIVSTDRFVVLNAGTTADLVTILGSQRPGQRLRLYNVLTNTITVKHTEATTVNTIRTPDGNDLVFPGNAVLDLVFDISTGQWKVVGNVGGGGGGTGVLDPIVLNEFNHGNQGAVSLGILWSDANFQRMVLTGNVGITHNVSSIAIGKWQELILEFTQDSTGNHSVTYTQGFSNGVVPLTNQLPTSKTTVAFYAYNTGTTTIILAFETRSAGNTNFIHATKATQQAAPLTVGNHVEFDTILSSSGITVSTGVGQLSGIFSGFKKGRTYECEGSLAFVGSGLAPEMAYQWFDIAGAALVGIKGHAKSNTATALETDQKIAKFIFQPADDTNTLELRFIFNNDSANNTMFGNPSATDPTSYVLIKDIT